MIVTHDENLAKITDRTIAMRDGMLETDVNAAADTATAASSSTATTDNDTDGADRADENADDKAE